MNYIAVAFAFIATQVAYSCQQREIVVVIASYNNKQWYKKNLKSVFRQDYAHYRIIYVDDCSDDDTGMLVQEFIEQEGKSHKVRLIRNKQRKGALANQFNAIHSCDPKAIIVILDGDDWLAHSRVLSTINKIYSDEKTWLTYGQFIEYPSYTVGFCCRMPEEVIQQNAFRQFTHIPSHMRTFYAGLFHRIKKEDLCDQEGNFLMMTGDIAAMFPMIEMACDHFKFVDEEIYIYNGCNEINDHKVSKDLQRTIDLMIRSKPCYEKLQELF